MLLHNRGLRSEFVRPRIFTQADGDAKKKTRKPKDFTWSPESSKRNTLCSSGPSKKTIRPLSKLLPFVTEGWHKEDTICRQTKNRLVGLGHTRPNRALKGHRLQGRAEVTGGFQLRLQWKPYIWLRDRSIIFDGQARGQLAQESLLRRCGTCTGREPRRKGGAHKEKYTGSFLLGVALSGGGADSRSYFLLRPLRRECSILHSVTMQHARDILLSLTFKHFQT
jgi:hypothetical protein